MTVEMAAQSIKRLRQCLQAELANLKQLKHQAWEEKNHALAATLRDLEKKYLEMEASLPPVIAPL